MGQDLRAGFPRFESLEELSLWSSLEPPGAGALVVVQQELFWFSAGGWESLEVVLEEAMLEPWETEMMVKWKEGKYGCWTADPVDHPWDEERKDIPCGYAEEERLGDPRCRACHRR